MEEFKDTLCAAKWVSTPLIVIRTTDPASAVQLIAHELFILPEVDSPEVYPTLRWAVVQGFKAVNNAGESGCSKSEFRRLTFPGWRETATRCARCLANAGEQRRTAEGHDCLLRQCALLHE